MASIFTKIIQNEISSLKIYEDDKCIAILDINPIQKYHTLIIPKKEVPYIFDIDDDLYKHLMIVSKNLSHILKKVSNCKKVCMAIQGFDIDHAHIHLIPCNNGADFDFKKASPRSNTDLQKDLENIMQIINNYEN